jgi:transcriptional regulator with XRE-family HTH domain
LPDGGHDWLASTLRQLRQDAGLSGVQAAKAAGLSQPRISRIEIGRFVPTDDEIRTLCQLYRAPAETRRALLQAAEDLRAETVPARVVMSRGGWKMQARFGRIESVSAEVCVYQPALIPGLLQTADYARLVFADGGDMPPEDVEQAVATRMARADVLDSDRAFVFIVAEGALHWQAGSPQIMIAQLEHIASIIRRRPNVRFGVIPQAHPVGVFTTHGFSLYDRRTVILGIRTGTSFINDPRDVAEYAKLFSDLEAPAVFGGGAVGVIEQVASGYSAILRNGTL